MQSLIDWVRHSPIADDMLWKKSAEFQFEFFHQLGYLLSSGLDYDNRIVPHVISFHMSKSINLPVCQYERDGLRVIVRDNFHDFKISVISEKPIEANFDGLFRTKEKIAGCYFEGFDPDWVFDGYSNDDKKKWSAEIHGQCQTWTTIYLCMKSLGMIKPLG